MKTPPARNAMKPVMDRYTMDELLLMLDEASTPSDRNRAELLVSEAAINQIGDPSDVDRPCLVLSLALSGHGAEMARQQARRSLVSVARELVSGSNVDRIAVFDRVYADVMGAASRDMLSVNQGLLA